MKIEGKTLALLGKTVRDKKTGESGRIRDIIMDCYVVEDDKGAVTVWRLSDVEVLTDEN